MTKTMSVEIVRVKEEPKWDEECESETVAETLKTGVNIKVEDIHPTIPNVKIEVELDSRVLLPQATVSSNQGNFCSNL